MNDQQWQEQRRYEVEYYKKHRRLPPDAFILEKVIDFGDNSMIFIDRDPKKSH